MRHLLLAAAVASILPLAACHASWEHKDKDGNMVAPSGPKVARDFAASDFTGVELTGVDDVTIRNGAAFSVKAEGQASVLDDLEIKVENGVLKIGRKAHEHWSWSGEHGAKISVTMPKLSSINITGTGDVDADKAEGDFSGSITGTGDIKLAALTGGTAKLSLSGTGDMTIAGTVTRLEAQVTGTGDIDGKGLTASGASVNVTGPGSVKAVVKGDADVSIMGPGDVELTGGAKCKVNSMGPGEAKCS